MLTEQAKLMLALISFTISWTTIMEQYRNLTQANYIPIPEPVTITSSLQSALFFHYYKDYNAEGVKVRFGIRLFNIYIQKFSSKFGTFSEIDLRFNEI